MNPNIKTVAVEPLESAYLAGGPVGAHKIAGLAPGFLPGNVDKSFFDEIMPIKSDDAITMSRRCATEEGLMMGISGGAAVQAGINLGKRPENAGKLIVVIIPSFGERYLSTVLFADLQKECLAMPTLEMWSNENYSYVSKKM